MRVVCGTTCDAVSAPGAEWQVSQVMRRSLRARRLARVAHSADCRYLVSLFDNLLSALGRGLWLYFSNVFLLVVLLVLLSARRP